MRNVVVEILRGISEGKDKSTLVKQLGINEEMFSAIVDSLIREGYLKEIRCDKNCSECIFKCYRAVDTRIYVLTGKAFDLINLSLVERYHSR